MVANQLKNLFINKFAFCKRLKLLVEILLKSQ